MCARLKVCGGNQQTMTYCLFGLPNTVFFDLLKSSPGEVDFAVSTYRREQKKGKFVCRNCLKQGSVWKGNLFVKRRSIKIFKTVVPNWGSKGPNGFTDIFLGFMTFVCKRWKENSEIPNYQPWWSSLQKTTNRAQIWNPGYRATQIWLMWTTTCLFISSKVWKLQLSCLWQRFLHKKTIVRHFDCYATMSICYF